MYDNIIQYDTDDTEHDGSTPAETTVWLDREDTSPNLSIDGLLKLK